jgi:adenylate cyclase
MLIWYRTGVTVPEREGPAVVVLPFESLAVDENGDRFSEALTEELTTELGRQQSGRRLRVIARRSALQYRGTQKSIGQIGRELQARYILEGTVRREQGRVRVCAQFVRVSDQTNLWADSFDYELGSALEIENEIARAVAGRIITLLDHKQA